MNKELEKIILKSIFKSWNDISNFKIGELSIGKDFIPNGQLIGNLLHILIPINMEKESNGEFYPGKYIDDKDIICKSNADLSIELKTSSTKNIYGNRCYSKSLNKKSKNSYYLTINYSNFTRDKKGEITLIKFGYITNKDWVAQKSETGQQSRLKGGEKLKILYKK